MPPKEHPDYDSAVERSYEEAQKEAMKGVAQIEKDFKDANQ